MNIKINSIKELWSKDQLVVNLTIDEILDGKPFDYLMALDKKEDSEVYKFILNAIDSKQIEIQSSSEDYTSMNIRNTAEMMLRGTDQFMTIDTELTEDEIKEMKEYRKSLRNISKSSDLRSLTKSSIPPLPKFLKQNQYNITYIGSDTSQEK